LGCNNLGFLSNCMVLNFITGLRSSLHFLSTGFGLGAGLTTFALGLTISAFGFVLRLGFSGLTILYPRLQDAL